MERVLQVVKRVGNFHRALHPDFGSELMRKSLHMLIAFVPTLALHYGTFVTLGLLLVGIVTYSTLELLRRQGASMVILSNVIGYAARRREYGRFVLGPVTLGTGAMLALLLFPPLPAAIAIYALAFGDSFASLVGKAFGTILIPWSGGKTLEGTLACLTAVFVCSYAITQSATLSMPIALAAALFELPSFEDMDNLLLPCGVGFIATLLTIT